MRQRTDLTNDRLDRDTFIPPRDSLTRAFASPTATWLVSLLYIVQYIQLRFFLWDDFLTKKLKSRYNINKVLLFYPPKFELFLVFSFWDI